MSRPSPAALGPVKVDPDFSEEYPGADSLSTEAFANVVRAGDALWAEHERRIQLTLGVNQTAAHALAVLDGAGEPITPKEVSERMVVPAATMTSTLDVLENRGWIRRLPNPADRRSVLLEITDEGRAITDRFIPGLHATEARIMEDLTPRERATLSTLLTKVLASAAGVAAEEPAPLDGVRRRRKRR